MAADTDSRSSSREAKGADPMAEHKRRARWRFLGALVIAGAVALAAPVFLEEQARPLSQDLLIEIPSRNSTFSKIESLKPAAKESQEAKPETKSEVKVEPKAEPKAKAEVKPEVKQEVKQEAKAEAKPLKGFMVQVGAYAKLESAAAVKSRLESGGHKAMIETVKLADGTERHRVRIGPFDTREQANEVRDRAKTQGYDAAVINP